MIHNISPKEPPEDLQRFVFGNPEGRVNAINIDRRTSYRVVPLKVLALGLSRSGTSSLRQALLDLGYVDCYHFAAVYNENPRDAVMWVEAPEAKYEGKGKPYDQKEWDQLLSYCMVSIRGAPVLRAQTILIGPSLGGKKIGENVGIVQLSPFNHVTKSLTALILVSPEARVAKIL